MTGLQYTILHPWLRLDHERSVFSGLDCREELFLSSPDSMTQLLEEMYGVELEVVAVLRERRAMDRLSATYLETTEGAEALARGVWIKADSRPLIYAFSLIPLNSVDNELLAILESEDPEPIGRTLSRNNIPFIKQHMEAGVIRCPVVAEGLGLAVDRAFFARRYVLTGHKAGRLAIKAAITEVFSPELIATDRLNP